MNYNDHSAHPSTCNAPVQRLLHAPRHPFLPNTHTRTHTHTRAASAAARPCAPRAPCSAQSTRPCRLRRPCGSARRGRRPRPVPPHARATSHECAPRAAAAAACIDTHNQIHIRVCIRERRAHRHGHQLQLRAPHARHVVLVPARSRDVYGLRIMSNRAPIHEMHMRMHAVT